jgi:hypothetical protein
MGSRESDGVSQTAITCGQVLRWLRDDILSISQAKGSMWHTREVESNRVSLAC